MNIFLISLNVAILLLLILGLYYMQKKQVSFSKRVFTGLGLGIIFGYLLHLIYGTEHEVTAGTLDWFSIVGNGYVKLLQMVVIPLIFISIVGAFTKLKLTKNIGKISFLVVGILIGTTAISAAVGIGSALGFGLDGIELSAGEAENARNEQLQERVGTVENMTIPQQILQFIPSNPFLDFTGARATSTIAVVFFAAIIGMGYLGVKRKEPEHAELFAKIIDSIYSIVMRVVTLILRLTPYGILAIIAKVAATSNYDAIMKLGTFVVASYVALAVVFIIHLLLLFFAKLNPVNYVKKGLPTLTFAFTSRTSAGTLPMTIKSQTKDFGVSEGIANFAGSFGLTIGQNGCAGVYPAMLAVMVAPAAGIDPTSPSFLISLILVVAISSFGVAGVGGGATFAALIVLSVMNLPITIVALLISVEPLIDMGRTAVNVSGAMTSGILTSKATGEFENEVYQQKDVVEV
ncbi:L-cystine transporter [Pseudalkalibacillus sp. Hm43]|uniref:L-cystine transporter n=1 Tax=Pseudalkalibacillus sp. Hm43 TaxID=3450742 RepID=UPI003F43861C